MQTREGNKPSSKEKKKESNK